MKISYTKLGIGVLGYIIAFISPLIGLAYGLVLFYTKRDDAFYNKHAKYIMFFAVIMFIVNLIMRLALG